MPDFLLYLTEDDKHKFNSFHIIIFLFHKAAFSLDLNLFSLQSHSLSHVQLYNKEFAAAAHNLQFMSVYN